MAKKQIDARVKAAMTLQGDLAVAVDTIKETDQKIAALVTARNAGLSTVKTAHQAARTAGWKARELTGAGLSVPRPLDLPTLTSTDAGTQPVAEPHPNPEDPSRLAG